MKKISTKANARSKGSGRKAKGGRLELDRGWNELEAQADRLKSDWMSLSVQLGIGGHQDKEPAFD
ncbi:MAG TPA: hypothetical protein VN915_00110 [Elusimicrobiota bacterium]|nr:hypothetical protein [Elusimicrobiota bacterium]